MPTAAAGLPLAAVIIATAYVEAGVSFEVVARPLAVAMIGTSVLTVAAVVLVRSSVGGGLVAAGIVLLLIAGGAIGTLITRTQPIQVALWVLLVAIAIFLLTRIVRRQLRRGFPDSSRFNLFAVAMLAIVIASAAINRTEPVPHVPATIDPVDPALPRDMVLVLLDGYPRADILERYFGYDNAAFIGELERRGFELATEARANYAWTELTLLSMLHMEHANRIDAFTDRGGGGRSQPWLSDLTNQNPVFDIVRKSGYEVATIGTYIDHVTLKSADEVRRPPGLTDFDLHLLRSTALAGLISTVDPAFFARSHREQVLWSIETLEQEASDPAGGRLLIAHVLSPHMPAVFESDGSLRAVRFDDDFYDDFRALGDQDLDAWNAAFLGQVKFVNTRILQALDAIIDGNPQADLVVFSDHGPGSRYRPDVPDRDTDERYSSLFAARTPGIPTPFANDQTPINIFPRWLNARLGLTLAEREDDAFAGYLDLVPIADTE
jgi:hypothetical protein